ncbi:MAG: hypothetical protein ACLVCH_13160 [Roseburia inulinivorans]
MPDTEDASGRNNADSDPGRPKESVPQATAQERKLNEGLTACGSAESSVLKFPQRWLLVMMDGLRICTIEAEGSFQW